MTSLRIVIQHRQTKQFCKSETAWTDIEEQAQEFASALNAFNFASQRNLGDVEILFLTRKFSLPINRLSKPTARVF